MNKLTIFERGGKLWADSRQVAAMVEKRHGDLLRDIRVYVNAMEKNNESKNGLVDSDGRKIASVDFFIESTYIDDKGQERPCFLCSKMGCEMIGNKLTGAKGIQFTATYVSQFNAMEQAIKLERFTEPYHYPAKSTSAGEVASLLTATDRPMIAQRSPGWKRAAQTELTLKHFGIPVIEDFVEKPPQQFTFSDMSTNTAALPPNRTDLMN